MCSLRMTSPFRIVIIATRHISSPFHAAASLRNALPLPTNTLLYFPLADQRLAYLWPVQAQHRYGAARHLFANHRLDFSFPVVALPLLSIASQFIACAVLRITCRFLSTPKQFQTYLFDSVPSLIFATLALAKYCIALRFFCRDVAALFFCFCQTMPSRAIAAPHISSLYQLRCLSALCYRFAERCGVLLQHNVSMPFLLLAILNITLPAHFHSFLMDRNAALFFCDAWIHCASPPQPIVSPSFFRASRIYSFCDSLLFNVVPLLFRIDIVPDE